MSEKIDYIDTVRMDKVNNVAFIRLANGDEIILGTVEYIESLTMAKINEIALAMLLDYQKESSGTVN